MKYELIKTDYSIEKVIDAETYSIDIILGLHPIDNVADNFSKVITVVSSNSKTGYEVDAQREKAIDDYLLTIDSARPIIE